MNKCKNENKISSFVMGKLSSAQMKYTINVHFWNYEFSRSITTISKYKKKLFQIPIKSLKRDDGITFFVMTKGKLWVNWKRKEIINFFCSTEKIWKKCQGKVPKTNKKFCKGRGRNPTQDWWPVYPDLLCFGGKNYQRDIYINKKN